MGNVPQHKIDEAAKRGIVPGATIESAWTSQRNPRINVVPEYDRWSLYTTGDIYFRDQSDWCFYVFDANKDRWAEVVSPAPSKEEEGLKEGDACECGPAMRSAIVELAKELGLDCSHAVQYHDRSKGLHLSHSKSGICAWISGDTRQPHTPEAFIAKMRVTAKHPKPIKIKVGAGNNCGEWEVKHEKGRVKIGECTYVDNATIRAIAEKLID